MDGAGELDLLRREIAVRVLGELLAEDEDAVERCPELVRHVGEELGLVFRGEGQLGRLFLDRTPRLLDLLVLALDLDVALGELLGLLLELLVGLLQLALLGLQLGGELLRLLEEILGLHRCFDRIENDADAGGELLEEGDLECGEGRDRGEFDDRLDLVLEEDRQYHDVPGLHPEKGRADRHDRIGNVGDQPAPRVDRTLADQALAKRDPGGCGRSGSSA